MEDKDKKNKGMTSLDFGIMVIASLMLFGLARFDTVVQHKDIESTEETGTYVEQRFKGTKEVIYRYMELKYGQRFEILGAGLKGLLEDKDYVVMCTQDDEERTFRAYLNEDGTVEEEYYSILKEDATADYLEEQLFPVLGQSYISAIMGRKFTDNDVPLVPDMVERVHSNNESLRITANIFIENTGQTEEELESLLNKAQEVLESNGLDGQYYLFCMASELSHAMTWEQLEELKRNEDNYVWKSHFTIR